MTLVLCPECRIPFLDERCPSCGASPDPEDQAREAQPGDAGSRPIKFEMVESRPSQKREDLLDWRLELRRRLEKHAAKKRGETEVEVEEDEEEEKPAPSRTGESAPAEDPSDDIFHYQLKKTGGPKLKNPVRSQEDHPRPRKKRSKKSLIDPFLNAPVDRVEEQKPGRSEQRGQPEPSSAEESETPPDPFLEKMTAEGQRFLDLRTPRQETSLVLEGDELPADLEGRRELEVYETEEPPEMSREILFSRFLAGLIDLTLPVITAGLFTALASRMLQFDLFQFTSLLWLAILSVAFFSFNSLFFLVTCGQTPGMYVTQLELLTEDGKDRVPMASVVARIILFVPSLLSVAGLAWALFDPTRRCVHDTLSSTRVRETQAQRPIV